MHDAGNRTISYFHFHTEISCHVTSISVRFNLAIDSRFMCSSSHLIFSNLVTYRASYICVGIHEKLGTIDCQQEIATFQSKADIHTCSA